MDDDDPNVREAAEVFIFMHRIFRASRNLRAHWFIDHLGKPVGIQKVPQSWDPPPDKDDEYAEEMTVVGVIPIGGDGTEVVGDEKFRVTTNTKCTYIARYYRIVYVLDLSPSIVVADDESNCCLVDRVIPSLRNSLSSSVKPFIIPGTTELFKPQVFTSVSLFIPFTKFEDSMTLCQGVLITESNVDMILESVETKFVGIFKRLFSFSRPILEQWGKLKRRHKHMKFDSLCESESASDENLRASDSSDKKEPEVKIDAKYIPDKDEEEEEEDNNIMSMQRGIWTATERHEDKQLPFASGKSYISPEWSLINMLRMGLLNIQMLPENTQSNLVIISDSVCGIPDEDALQKVLTQLRSYTVAFTFIQLQKRACTEPVFGHVGSCSLFQFMTLATFGTYLPRRKPRPPKPVLEFYRAPDGQLHCKRTVDHDDLIDPLFGATAEPRGSPSSIHGNLRSDVNRMMYVRLREGFTLKSTVFVKNNKQVILTLRLAFRPLVFLDYIITSQWPVNKNVHQLVNVELVLEAPYNELKDLLTESEYVNPIRMNLIKSVIDGIIDADRLLLHIHAFDTKSAFFTIPAGVTKEHALFRQGDYSKQTLPQLCIVREDGLRTRGFVNFWKKMLRVDDSNWQKWVHTQTERIILNLIHSPFDMFTTKRVLRFDSRYAMNAVLYSVKVRASFCLVENQTYVTLIYVDQSARKPKYFFIRKVTCEGQVAVIKTAFLGGVPSISRRKAVEAQRQRLINVTYGTILDESELRKEARRYNYEPDADKVFMDPVKIFEKRYHAACAVFRRPLERIIIKYSHVPRDLTSIVRADETHRDDEDEITLITIHNALAKTLACRRSIIILNRFEEGGAQVIRLLADFCQNVIMYKRLNKEGYRPAWTENNAVSVVRQVFDGSGCSLEQFIMFPTIAILPDFRGRPILKRKCTRDDMDLTGKNRMPLKTSTDALAIVSEMWNEPEGGKATDQLANMSAEQRLHEDLRFISVLFTLDRIIRSSGQCTEEAAQQKLVTQADVKNQMFPYEDRCKCTNIYELTGIPRPTPVSIDEKLRQKKMKPKSHRRTEKLKTSDDLAARDAYFMNGPKIVPKPPTPGIFPIRFVPRKPEGEEELLGELDDPFPYVPEATVYEEQDPVPTITDIHADAVSKFVTAYSNLFSLTNLVFHAARKYLPLPHFVLGVNEDDKPRCNALQLNALHCQLSEFCDLTWMVDQTENDVVFADLVKALPEEERPATAHLRVYVKALTARLIALIFVPAIEPFNIDAEEIPMFIQTVHEAQIAHCYAFDGFDKNGIVNIPMTEVREQWDSGARFGWTPNNRNVFPDEATNFSGFVRHFEEEILPRIRIRSMYEAAQQRIPLNELSLIDMSSDVECLEIELTAIPSALRNVCQHLQNRHNVPAKEKICCKGSNIEHMFNKMINKNFKRVEGTENMFYLNPETMVEPIEKKKSKKKKSPTQTSPGMMYVEGEDSSSQPLERSADGSVNEVKSESESESEAESVANSDHDAPVEEAISEPDIQPRSRCSSLNLQDGERFEEYAGITQPMFMHFNCTVTVGLRIYSFLINYLPTCIHEVLSHIDNPPTEQKDILRVKIVLELYILTTQRMNLMVNIRKLNTRLLTMSKCRPKNPYEFERQRRESFRKEDYDIYKDSDDEDEEKAARERRSDALGDLEPEERKVMSDLIKNVGVVLELEKILMEARSESVTKEQINRVKGYIEVACKATGKVGHAENRFKPFLLVDNCDEKLTEFMTMLDGRECGYLKLTRLEGTNLFYCRNVLNQDLYMSIKEAEMRAKAEKKAENVMEDEDQPDKEKDEEMVVVEEREEEVTAYKEPSDFWIILTADRDKKTINLHFCQRYENQHTEMLEQLWAGIRQELRVLNQASLLGMLYSERICDKLLIAEHQEITQFENETLEKKQNAQKAGSPPEEGKPRCQRGIYDKLPDDLYFYFIEGYFSCPLQKEIWFPIPDRILNQSRKLHKHPLTIVFEKMKLSLISYSIHNRPNTFVYRDAEHDQIIYFQLHMDRESYTTAVKGAKTRLRKKHLEKVVKMLETNVCMTIFGIAEPQENVVQHFWKVLNEKIDALLLVEIMRGYSQNLEQPLVASEVAFLQPADQPPQIRSFFTIPTIFHEFLSSLLFYVGQHIEELPNISPAKIKENGLFYNGAAFMKTPITPWEIKRKKTVEISAGEDDGIDQGVEVREGSMRGFSFDGYDEKEPDLKKPVVTDASELFLSLNPIAGTLPSNYPLSSFFVYHMLPDRGVIHTGIALIEFRIVKPNGELFTHFDQPSMNEQSHKLLVPNVLDDKATVYKDIIRSQQCEKPKCPPEKTICGYLEMIAWTKGDVVEELLEKLMHELIEMSMFDVITEFGYLNTTIVEEGVLTGTVAANRNSEVLFQAPESVSSEPKQLNKQGSASSVTVSVDNKHPSGEIRKSLVHGGSVDIGLNPGTSRTAVGRMPSIAKDIESSLLRGDDYSLRRQDFMNRKNAYSIIKWLDYVASKQGETNSVVKQTIRFEFQHASLPALFEIRNRLEVSLGGLYESDIRERVYLCGLRKPTEMDSYAGVSLRESSLSIFGTATHDARFEVLTTDPFHAMTGDCGVDESQCQEEYILVSCIHNVFEGYGENMIRTKTQVEEMKQMFRNHLHGKYNPLVQTHMYSPRQRIMMAHLKGDFMTIYFYNYHNNIHTEAVDCVNKIVGFHNAKSRLLREIGLHKMGITHLSPFHTEPHNEYDYEVLIWTDPTALISKEFPGDHKPPPPYMREPQCSNIFFRMYRQPDLQVTMGRTKTLFKSDCVRTMHYEQMLRWRSGLRNRIEFVIRCANAHVEMMKKSAVIFERDLFLFIRPPKVAKKLGPPPTNTSSSTSVRYRHHEDDHTEDNGSMTERTSKRASVYGESLRSQAIAESEIFKGKGEFLKKTELKLDLAATKFHEIRTPLFLRSDWNKDVPRRAGILVDEVVRETDLRLALEDSLKELHEFVEVQKAKANKQLMKRKYSEKNVEVIISDVTVKEVEGLGDDEEAAEEEEVWSDEESEVEDETRGEGWEKIEECEQSSRSNSESKPVIVGDENFQRTFGKVRRAWIPNPPTSPAPLDSRHNSISAAIPVVKPSDSGPIEKMFSFTLNAASKLSRKLSRKQPDKDQSIDKGEEATAVTAEPLDAPENALTSFEDPAMEAAVSPIIYKHAEEFARYFTRKYNFIQFNVEQLNRRSRHLNRYTTNSNLFHDLPYLVFFKAYDGGIIFADLKYEMPEFVVSFHLFDRAKASSADYYMIPVMEALYTKESEELHVAANQLKESVCFMTFNFDYHLRAVASFLDSKLHQTASIFGSSINVFLLIERLLDYYQHDLIISSNLVAIKYIIMTTEQSDETRANVHKQRTSFLLELENDNVTNNRYDGTPIEEAICKISQRYLYKSRLPVTIIEMTGLIGEAQGTKRCRVVPSIKLQVHTEDVDDGQLWLPADDRQFVNEFEGKQRQLLLENMSKYGPEHVPTPWEDSCVRRTVRDILEESAN
ncbi:unnamed protein product [Caenorhabditis sp. 36 PRJEB53466]|nr:unnamed protein product [Caenorhabditis sp. 36 PRJEB53466]